MDGFMIRHHRRGSKEWRSVLDADGDVRFFSTSEEAHEVKESLELSHPDYSYNVNDHDASAK